MYQQCIMLKPASACKKLGLRLMVLKKVILRFVIANQDGDSQKVVEETNEGVRLNIQQTFQEVGITKKEDQEGQKRGCPGGGPARTESPLPDSRRDGRAGGRWLDFLGRAAPLSMRYSGAPVSRAQAADVDGHSNSALVR